MTKIADTMRAIVVPSPGAADVLTVASVPTPVPKPGEVLVAVAYAGVNGPDLMQRRGLYPPPRGASELLGLEVAGTVVACGEGAQRWRIGDQVCALVNGGGYAAFCAVLADHCLAIPDGLDLAASASLPEAYFTVWSNVFAGVGLRAGETLLVHGGAGSLGTAAIQLGKAFGAKVVATDSPRPRLAFCTELGADRVIDHAVEDFVEIVRNEFGGADVIIDIVGGDNIQRNVKAARHDARIVQLAFARGANVQIDLMPLMLKRLHYTGSTLRSRSDVFKTMIARALEAEVWPRFARRDLRPVVDRILPLHAAADAHRLMESAGQLGKIVLDVHNDSGS